MKICILGTRGIPNNYGGFEECAEFTSQYFAQKGHDVTVYCPDYHPYPANRWKEVKLKKIFSKENIFGRFGNLAYEFLSIKHATRRDFDIILELGTEYALFSKFFKKGKAKIVTNVDGLETRREKWSGMAKYIIALSEKNAIKQSDAIVADNPEIKNHVDAVYNISSHYIGYGASVRNVTNVEEEKAYLNEYALTPFSYCLLIARLEPENNIEMIVEGYVKSKLDFPLLIVGPVKKKYGKYLVNKYKAHANVKFLGGIYNKKESLNALRHFAYIYFHGHSVGGTNPALLEAMGQGSMIFAHDNKFNRYVLGNGGVFFGSPDELSQGITAFSGNKREEFASRNFQRLKSEFSWEKISDDYLRLFNWLVNNKK
jgi:glycosyltransferase involved in cell wall biosynthesis